MTPLRDDSNDGVRAIDGRSRRPRAFVWTASIVGAPLLLAFGCSAPLKPPPMQAVRLAAFKAEFRDYRGHDICTAEPRWLSDELQGPLSLMGHFVRAASANPDAAWSEETTNLLQEGLTVLPPLVDAVEANLRLAQECSFSEKAVLKSILKEGPGRCAQVRRTIPVVPQLLAYVAARAERRRWQDGRSERFTASADRCAAGHRPLQVRQWVQDCDGAEEWQFCDGASLRRSPGQQAPEWLPSYSQAETGRGKKGKKRAPPPTREDYLAAAKDFTEVDRCPALPARPAVPGP